MNTYIIIYNGESDFIKVETEHPETLIIDLIKEGYAQDDIEIYKAKVLGIEIEYGNMGVRLHA